MHRSQQLAVIFSAIFIFGNVSSAEIRGRVLSTDQQPLPGVRVNLYDLNGQSVLQAVDTNSIGDYSFPGVNNQIDYRIEISTSSGKENYVWFPEKQYVSFSSSGDLLQDVNFRGTFSFSNYKKTKIIDLKNIPQMRGLLASSNIVMLKIYYINPLNTSQRPVLFLGQIQNSNGLELEVSLPLYVKEITYEIFSESVSRNGLIAVN